MMFCYWNIPHKNTKKPVSRESDGVITRNMLFHPDYKP